MQYDFAKSFEPITHVRSGAIKALAVTQALADPKVKEQYDARGFQVVGNSSDAFATFLKQESDASTLLVRRAGIKAE